MANENFLLMQKTGASVATSTATWGIYLTAMPMLNGRERKEMEANDWLDEHGDDPYFGETIYYKAYDVTLKCAVVGTMAIIQEALTNLLSYLTTGGTELMIWSEWVKRGRIKTSFVSLSEPEYGETKDESLPFVAQFELVLHVSDPNSNVVCRLVNDNYVLASATKTILRTSYSNLRAYISSSGTAAAASGSTVTVSVTATATRVITYTDGSVETFPGTAVTPTNIAYTVSDGTIATISSAGVVTFTSANTSTTSARSVGVTAVVSYNDLTANAWISVYQTYVSTTYYAYYGSSATAPTTIDTSGSKVTLSSSTLVSVTTTTSDHKKCHWVAFLTSSGYRVSAVVDVDGDDISGSCTTTTAGMYTVVALTSGVYIGNTTKFTVRK